MERIIPLACLALALGPSLVAQPRAPALQRLDVVRPDIDVVPGFEHCSAAPAPFARLQDELRRAGFDIAVRRDHIVAQGQRTEWIIVARRPDAGRSVDAR